MEIEPMASMMSTIPTTATRSMDRNRQKRRG